MLQSNQMKVGNQLHQWVAELFPICRSITGQGVRETLHYIKTILPSLIIKEVTTGYEAFDWTVPNEWNISEAYIENEQGEKIIDFRDHNLHVLNYSIPVDRWMSKEELEKYIYTLPEQPDAIPYVTSYYKERWGFCMTHHQKEALPSGQYHAVIDSKLKPGVLNYGELILPGKTKEEVFLSTYICHPSMANNELSGPVVTTALAQWITNFEDRYYTYRIVFIPETIGSIVYLSRNLNELKNLVIAGFNITCVGDERCYSYLPSRAEDTLSDLVALHVLKYTDPNFQHYSWLNRGSDERQYCAPGIDLPIASIMRSKYGEYPEYHTSLDDLNLVTPRGLEGSFLALQQAIKIIESNCYLKTKVFGEPQLGKRGLYPTTSSKSSASSVRTMMNLISYCDGTLTLLEIADLIHEPFWELVPIVETLMSHDLLEKRSSI